MCLDCLPLLAEAVELYRDDFLAGFTWRDSPAFDEWQFFQSQDLRAELASALERLARPHGGQGEHQPAIAYARRWLALDSLHEPAHRCLMGLYARFDQRAAALRQYAECERILKEELGVPPKEETARLYQAIKEHREGTAAEAQPERYRLERKLSSRGSFGDLWLATDTLLDRPVAVKRPKGARDPRPRQRFLTEARMLARLNHVKRARAFHRGEEGMWGCRVEIRWETMGLAARLDMLDRDPPPIFVAAWSAGYPDTDNFLRASSMRPHTRWRNEAYDRLVEEAAIMPLCYGRVHILVKPWVRNLPIAALEGWFWKDVIVEPH